MMIDLAEFVANVFFAALIVGTTGSVLSVLGPPLPAPQRVKRQVQQDEQFRGWRGIL